MPYVTDNDSKATRRIAEIEQRLQEAKAEFERWLAGGQASTDAAELAQREREGKTLTDRLQALATALELQRALASAALHEQERRLAKASPKKMKDFGYRPVTVQFLGGVEVKLMARYWCRMDGTLKGPDEVFRLMEFYLRELEIDRAKEVLFIADGARWIWLRVTQLWQRLGLDGVRCRELVDFYHVVEHVYALAALNKSWSAAQRKRWATRQRRRLCRGELKAFIAEVQRLCRGKRAKGWARERDYLLRNARAGRLDYAKARRAKMPIGSGTMESTVRRVVNLRLKGAGIFWHEDHAEQMLLLRTYYKSKHWQVLTNEAFATPLTCAA